MTDIISRQPTFIDVLCEHDPPGTQPGDVVEGPLRVQCWVRRIPARSSEEAGQKAEKFLTEQKHVGNIRVKRWRFSRPPQKGVKS